MIRGMPGGRQFAVGSPVGFPRSGVRQMLIEDSSDTGR